MTPGTGATSRPRITIVIIFLNGERFLAEAIESVLAQTYRNWELLLVDDGSTDGSAVIARAYADQSASRIRYLTHPRGENRGMSASRNLGIRNGSGEYVALLDADDVWLPEKLERQVEILDANPEVAMVYGPTQWWYGWTGLPSDVRRDFIHPLGLAPDAVISPPTLLVALLRDEGVSPCTCSMLIRRDVLRELGGFEERFRGLYEDQALCAKVCLRWPIFAASQCWYRYRQHPDSACSIAERAGTREPARMAFLDWLAGWLDDRGVDDPQVRATLEHERRRLRTRPTPSLPARAPAVLRAAGDRARALFRTLRGAD